MRNENAEETRDSEPVRFRRRFGVRARDPGSISDRFREKELAQAEYNPGVWDFELYLLCGPGLIFVARQLGGLLPGVPPPGSQFSLFCLALWALGVAFFTPWIVWRVDGSVPRGDPARAAALLAFGLLAWPLAGLAAMLAPEDQATAFGFLVAYVLGGSAMIVAGLSSPPPKPSVSRALLLAGGAFVYLVCAGLLAVVLFAPLLGLYAWPDGSSLWPLFGLAVVAIYAVMAAWAVFGLGREALRAWRGRHLTSAAP